MDKPGRPQSKERQLRISKVEEWGIKVEESMKGNSKRIGKITAKEAKKVSQKREKLMEKHAAENPSSFLFNTQSTESIIVKS